MRMIVRIPTCTSSLTTMLIDGAPIPLVAQTTGAPPGSVAAKASRPRWRDSTRIPVRWSVAIRSERDGSPLSKAIVVPSSRSAVPNPRWYSAPSAVTSARLSREVAIRRSVAGGFSGSARPGRRSPNGDRRSAPRGRDGRRGPDRVGRRATAPRLTASASRPLGISGDHRLDHEVVATQERRDQWPVPLTSVHRLGGLGPVRRADNAAVRQGPFDDVGTSLPLNEREQCGGIEDCQGRSSSTDARGPFGEGRLANQVETGEVAVTHAA